MTIPVILERLPSRIAFGQISGPGYSTQVVETAGGFAYSNQYWVNPRRRYQVDTMHAGLAESAALGNFISAVAMGRANIWLACNLNDPDFIASDAQFGTGDISVLVYQLFKPYVFGSKTYNRLIHYPNDLTPLTIEVNGVVDGGAVVDLTTGLVTLSSHPANGALLTWSGSFDVPCRFDEDYQALTFENPAQINAKQLTFTEQRVS